MEDLVLRAEIGGGTMLYVSAIDHNTFHEHVAEDNLGGSKGYFVIRTGNGSQGCRFEILAKATSFDAASDLFDLIVGNVRTHSH
jgi:hypothetical protein